MTRQVKAESIAHQKRKGVNHLDKRMCRGGKTCTRSLIRRFKRQDGTEKKIIGVGDSHEILEERQDEVANWPKGVSMPPPPPEEPSPQPAEESGEE